MGNNLARAVEGKIRVRAAPRLTSLLRGRTITGSLPLVRKDACKGMELRPCFGFSKEAFAMRFGVKVGGVCMLGSTFSFSIRVTGRSSCGCKGGLRFIRAVRSFTRRSEPLTGFVYG